MSNRYLRKRDGDPFVYIYTDALMERGDMVECDGPGPVVDVVDEFPPAPPTSGSAEDPLL